MSDKFWENYLTNYTKHVTIVSIKSLVYKSVEEKSSFLKA